MFTTGTESEMFAKYRRRLEYAIERINANNLFVYHHVSSSFHSRSSFSGLKLDLAACIDDDYVSW